MLAYRQWELTWDTTSQRPALRSLVWATTWESAMMSADRMPTPQNDRGLHGFTDAAAAANYCGPTLAVNALVFGAVDLYGAVIVHDDGIVRGQHARILGLRILPPPCGCNRLVAVECYGTLWQILYCLCRYLALQDVPIHREFDTDELERLLLGTYGVPRLPDTVGLPQ